MAVFPLRGLADVVLRRMNAEQLTKEVRSIAPFLVPFLKMTCIYFILWLDQGTFPAAFVKCLPLLSLIWFVCLLGVSDRHVHQYNRKILMALVMCCVGDFLLVWAEQNEIFFLLGLWCFGIGHIIYSFAFGWRPFGLKELVFCQCVGVSVTAYVVSHMDGPLFYTAIVYGMLMILMVWRALARFSLKGDIPWRKICTACGATLFSISDIFLAINKFCWPVIGERYIIMATYFAAQLCISLSAVNSCLVHPAPRTTVENQHFHLNRTVVKKISDGDIVQDGDAKYCSTCSCLNRTVTTAGDTELSGEHSNTDDVIHNALQKIGNDICLNGTDVHHSEFEFVKHSKSD